MTTTSDTVSQIKEQSQQNIGARSDALIALSHRIHAHPELSFEEVEASKWCAEMLEENGFAVDAGICDLPTAFRASIGSGPLNIAVCAEYDALPDIGHACGHNIIAASALGTALSLAPFVDELGITLTVMGTPAEEGGGGKIIMLDGGGFDGINAAMMIHPWPTERVQMPCLAVAHLDIHYTGKEAHASAYPELGINAADAITVAQVAIGLLRQHGEQSDQVHGIVTHGGEAPNIVPNHTSAKYYVRSKTLERLATWQKRIEKCFEAGALATGASVDLAYLMSPYSEFDTDEVMATIYRRNAEQIGRVFAPPEEKVVAASTDMANVSLALPSIHPTIGIESLPAVNHQADFAAHCVTPVADKALLEGAAAMAWTIIDLANDDEQRTRLMASGTHTK